MTRAEQMSGGTRIRIAFWTLSDQAIVSIGAFLSTVLLARFLPTAEYGAFGLLLSGMTTLQMMLASLVFHPLSIRRSVAIGRARARLAYASLAIGGVLCAPLVLILCGMLLLAGRADLVAPASCLFLAWQLQETLRRNLISELRFRTAAIGDAIAYLGQACAALGLGTGGHLTLEFILWAGTGLFLLAAAIQATQLSFAFTGIGRLWSLGHEFWEVGSWSLLSNAASIVRLQGTPWLLALLYGPAAVALLQGATNVVNLANPIMTGLCNVIPQAAARARAEGTTTAWHAARHFALLGAPLVVALYLLVLSVPDQLLWVIYGASSPYLTLGNEVRVLALGAAMGFATETVCAYFHGIDKARSACLTNASGALICLPALPLIWTQGVIGACFAIAASQSIRLLTAQILLARTISGDIHAA